MKKVLLYAMGGLLFYPLFLSIAAYAEEDHPSEILIRQNNQLSVETTLSKNFYRTEYRDEWVTHGHYGDHDPENHNPSEWYEEYEDQEQYCHEVQYWEDVPYYVDETYWYTVRYQERVCQNRIIYEEQNVCRIVWVIENGRQVQRKICERQLVPRTIQECHYEWRERPVQRTRRVLRYRQELRTRCEWRYRTVTKKRLRTFSEAHIHSVPYQVLDRTETRRVVVHFPEAALLFDRETESVELSFDGEFVTLNVSSRYYVYQETDRRVNDDAVVITLGLGTLDEDAYGRGSISGLQLSGEDLQTVVRFVDEKPFYRVRTTYYLMVLDENGDKVVDGMIPESDATSPLRTFSVPLAPGQGSMRDSVFKILRGYIDYRLILTVKRESVLFEGGELSFKLEAMRQGILDNGLFGSATISDLRLLKYPDGTRLKIVDEAANHERVGVIYSIKIERKGFWGYSTIGRAHWASDGSQEMLFLLRKGAANPIGEGLEEHVEQGETYRMTFRVLRTCPLFTGGQVSFEVERTLKVK